MTYLTYWRREKGKKLGEKPSLTSYRVIDIQDNNKDRDRRESTYTQNNSNKNGKINTERKMEA